MVDLEKQLAEVIEAVNRTKTNQEFYSTLLEKSLLGSGGVAGFLLVSSDGYLSVEAAKCVKPAIWKMPVIKIGRGFLGRAARQGAAQLVSDVAASEISNYFSQKNKSLIILPIIFRGNLLAVLVFVHKKQQKVISGAQENSLQKLADTIALACLAFANGSNLSYAEMQKTEIKMLTETCKALTESFGFSEILYSVLSLIADFSNAKVAAVARYDKTKDKIIIQFPSFGITRQQAEKFVEDSEKSFAAKALYKGLSHNFGNFSEDEQEILSGAGLQDIKNIVAVPLKTRGQTKGVLYLMSDVEKAFEKNQIDVIEKIAASLASSIAHSETEKQWLQEKDRAQIVLGAINEGICAIDGEGKIVLFNAAAQKILGFKEEEALKKNFSEVFINASMDKDEVQVKELFSSAKPTNNNLPIDITLKKKNSHNVAVSLFALPVENNAGEVRKIIIFRDRGKELMVEKMQEELITIATHELRNPLTGIKGYLEMVIAGDTGAISENTRDALEEARVVTARLERLIEDILYVSQIEEGKTKVIKMKFNLSAVIDKAVAEMQIQAREKKLLLAAKIPSNIYARGDAEKTEQVILNLIDNAIKYTPRGEIWLTAKKLTGGVEIEIKDSGIGLSSDQIANLFSKFYRVKSPQTKNVSGTGLGLWIAKHLIEIQGGKIWVSSRKGQGSSFKFSLPKANW